MTPRKTGGSALYYSIIIIIIIMIILRYIILFQSKLNTFSIPIYSNKYWKFKE